MTILGDAAFETAMLSDNELKCLRDRSTAVVELSAAYKALRILATSQHAELQAYRKAAAIDWPARRATECRKVLDASR